MKHSKQSRMGANHTRVHRKWVGDVLIEIRVRIWTFWWICFCNVLHKLIVFDISVCLKHNTGCWNPLTACAREERRWDMMWVERSIWASRISSAHILHLLNETSSWECVCEHSSHKFHSLDCSNFMGVWRCSLLFEVVQAFETQKKKLIVFVESLELPI